MEISKFIKYITEYYYSSNDSFNECVHIGYGIDNNFARCTAASIVSFCENNPERRFFFHILEVNLSEDNKTKFKMLAKNFSINLIIYNIDISNLKNLPSNVVFTTAMYFRYIFPFILKEIKKIIYIDGDTLCLNKAEELFNINLDDKIIAAVPDSKWANSARNKVLGLENHIYFLSGMLVINVEKWHKFDTFNKLIKCLSEKQDRFMFPDQDALNLVLTNNIKYIGAKFNWAKVETVNKSNIKDIIILHYAASPKPWFLSWSVNPKANDINRFLYSYYEKQTPFEKDALVKPTTYKEMEHYSKYLRQHKLYKESFLWYIKYLIKKLFK